jgi:S1-C subfamily serine protease
MARRAAEDMMVRFALLLLALVALARPAHADDVSASARSVVRVVTVAIEDGEVVGFGHGSGVAVGRNRIVTNAHVVAIAAQYPDNVAIGVVPSEGSKSYGARLIAFDPKRDLALLEMSEGSIPAATLYTGAVPDGAPVVALGYPGNVDLATARSAEDYIRPQQPARSDGNYSNERLVDGVRTLLHTANIARGSSGGPLLDRCGRVLGINTFITHGEDGDAPFGFAIANSELAAFLSEAKQGHAAAGTACVSMEDRLREEQSRSEREIGAQAAAERETMARAEQAALEKARAANQDARENRLAIALLLSILAVAALGGGGLMLVKDRNRPAAILAGVGGLLLIGAVVAFLSRPARDQLDIEPVSLPKRSAEPERLGPSLCKLVPERSRATVSSVEDVKIDWGADGCMNGRTQYARRGAYWSRILVPGEEQTVSVLDYRPGTGEYVVTRYLMGAGAMAKARELRRQVEIKACSTDPEKVTILGDRQESIRETLPAVPNERLVYSCTPE